MNAATLPTSNTLLCASFLVSEFTGALQSPGFRRRVFSHASRVYTHNLLAKHSPVEQYAHSPCATANACHSVVRPALVCLPKRSMLCLIDMNIWKPVISNRQNAPLSNHSIADLSLSPFPSLWPRRHHNMCEPPNLLKLSKRPLNVGREKLTSS